MSLLLLFPYGVTSTSTGSGGGSTNFCWHITTSTATPAWINSHYDFKNIWGEWETYTWAQIASRGLTWDNMAGFMFVTTTGNATTWTVVDAPVENCSIT